MKDEGGAVKVAAVEITDGCARLRADDALEELAGFVDGMLRRFGLDGKLDIGLRFYGRRPVWQTQWSAAHRRVEGHDLERCLCALAGGSGAAELRAEAEGLRARAAQLECLADKEEARPAKEGGGDGDE